MTAKQPLGAVKRWLADRLVEGPPPAWLRWATRNMVHDAVWHRYYLQQRALDAALTGSALSSAQQGAVLDRVLDQLQPADRPRRRWLWSTVGAAAMAAAAVLFVIVPDGEQFTPRGSGGTLGLQMHCVSPDAEPVVEASVAVGPGRPGALRCSTGAELAFSITNTTARAQYVRVVGIADGDLVWFGPFDDAAGLSVAAKTVDAPAPSVASLDGQAGKMNLFVLFSDAPIGKNAVRDAVAAGGRGGTAAGLSRLPISQTQQTFVELDVTDGGPRP